MKNFYACALFMILGIVMGVVESNKVWNSMDTYVLAIVAVAMIFACLAGVYFGDTLVTRQLVMKTTVTIASTILLLTASVLLWSKYALFLYRNTFVQDMNVVIKIVLLFVPLIVEFTLTSVLAYMINRYLKTHDINWFNKKVK